MRAHGERFVAGVLFVWVSAWLFAAVSAGDARLEVTKEWSIARTWKDARKGYHFYSGTLPFRNTGKKEIRGLRAEMEIIDAKGKVINRSKSISFGTVGPGKVAKKSFRIDKAVQYSELLIQTEFTVGGAPKRLTFSARPQTRPVPLLGVDDSVMEVQVLADEIDRTILGKRKDKYSRLTVRLRNRAAVPARQPTAVISFKLTKKYRSSTKKSKKTPPKKAEFGKLEVDKSRKTATMRVLLDEGAMKPGETKTYTKEIRAPEYLEYKMKVSATWPQEETEVVTESFVEEVGGGGGQVQIGAVSVSREETGKKTVEVTIKNTGSPIPAKALILSFTFFAKGGKKVARFDHTCSEEMTQGQSLKLKIPGQTIPAYQGYETGWSIAAQAPPKIPQPPLQEAPPEGATRAEGEAEKSTGAKKKLDLPW